jgi:hypothetical protein
MPDVTAPLTTHRRRLNEIARVLALHGASRPARLARARKALEVAQD